jgi:PAS domain S-box-containing protein
MQSTIRERPEIELFLISILKDLAEPFAIGDIDGPLLYGNPAFSVFTGFTEGELETMDWRRGLDADENTFDREILAPLPGRRGKARLMAIRCRRKIGKPVPVIAAVRFFDRLVVLNFIDASAYPDDGIRSSRENELFRTIVTCADESICLVNKNCVITYANARMARMLGYDDEAALVGRRFPDLMTAASARITRRKFENRKRGQTERYAVAFRHVGGSKVSARIVSTPVYEDGEFAGAFAVISDVTESKRYISALKKSERRFRSLSDQLPVAVCEIDAEARITYLNEFGLNLLHVSPVEARKRLLLRDFVIGDSSRIFDQLLSDANEKEKTRYRKMSILTKDGQIVSSFWNVARMQGDGETGFRIVILDIMWSLKSSLLPDDEFYDGFHLTEREREISNLVIAGFLYKEIGWRLHIGLPTVRTHISNLYRKMEVNSREDLLTKIGSHQIDQMGSDRLMQTMLRYLF